MEIKVDVHLKRKAIKFNANSIKSCSQTSIEMYRQVSLY